MIHGIGTDIVLIERIEKLLARWGDRFARRVLGPDELAEFLRRRGRGEHGQAYAALYLAKRFAAKEAFGKALGLGLRAPMTLLSLQVLNDKRGRPVAHPRKALAQYLDERGLVAQVSLSDEVDSAVAFVVIESRAEEGAGSGAGTGSASIAATDTTDPADPTDPTDPTDRADLTDSTKPSETRRAGAGKRDKPRRARLPRGPVIVDVAGFELTDAERERLLHPLVGGVILFARNFESREQVARLCRQIHKLRKPKLLVCVDHEGGRVQRFREGFTAIPPMRELGALWNEDMPAACRRATEIGRTIGEELRAVGVDLSFTPVLDLDWGESEVIGDRAFHRDPRVVAVLARCLDHGLLQAGMANCGKHFPGHGFVSADSHLEAPVDPRKLDAILADDAAPYGWLTDTLLSVMPAHVVYPEVDAQPAGFSKHWLQEILREQIGFRGLVFSDDLTMEGAAVAGDIAARADAALNAGCDMVLVCNRPDLADELLGRLQWQRPKGFHRRLKALFRG